MPQWDYSGNGIYFITLVTQNRECTLGRIHNGEIILSDFGKIVNDEWLKTFEIRDELYLVEYIIMPNHIHAIVVLDNTRINDFHDFDGPDGFDDFNDFHGLDGTHDLNGSHDSDGPDGSHGLNDSHDSDGPDGFDDFNDFHGLDGTHDFDDFNDSHGLDGTHGTHVVETPPELLLVIPVILTPSSKKTHIFEN